MVKRLPAMRGTWVRFLGWEDPLEKEMAIHSSTLAWKIPWTEEPERRQSMGLQRVDTTERLHFHFHFGMLAPAIPFSVCRYFISQIHFRVVCWVVLGEP